MTLPEPETEADFATLRNLGRTTIGKSFSLQFGSHSDIGAPTRTIWQIISEDADCASMGSGDEEEVTLRQSPAGRVQVKARVVRERGRVAELRFERVMGRANRDAHLENLLTLDEDAAGRLIELCYALKGIDPSGSETLKLDDDLLAAVMADPKALSAAYDRDPEGFVEMIKADVTATDVVAIAARKEALKRFEILLDDPDEFERARDGGGREAVWQRFFEGNPWILGVGLSGHLFTSWDGQKLERAVAGSTVADFGKRVDAMLTTSGAVRSLVLAEIKLPGDPLLERDSYRAGCWVPSREVSGGVAQAHITAERARDDLGTWLTARDDDGFDTGEAVYAGVPRSYVVVGRLSSLMRGDQLHRDKVRSFELYRRHLSYPEVLTYDEVLARARWTLHLLEAEAE
ncbi:Shedu immune nuclease family protein [Janibacter melonis]|uniref:Shedu immune nuclease family protein n=1 Tax=Janibacter melonis TaxID=262209 RepID=UPI0013D48F07|nr:Shedu immune nuclease family protein [Janibacter melonis]